MWDMQHGKDSMRISEHAFVRDKEGRITPRLFVIDDDELIRQLLRDTLEQAGYEVVEARNLSGYLKCPLRIDSAYGILDEDHDQIRACGADVSRPGFCR
jgi:hypothetical protein